MKKRIALKAALTAATISALTGLFAQSADAFSLSTSISNPTGYTSGAQVINFDDPLPTGVTLSGGAVVSGNSSGVYASPFPTSGGKYLTVGPSGVTAGPATLKFAFSNLLNYYGLYWGSVDSYNKLEFLRDGNVVGTFNGSQFIPPAIAGAQGTGGSIYVNFFADNASQYFNEVRLTSTQFAFESDNHAYRVVPTPALLPGLIGMGAAALRKKRKEEASETAEARA
ncbi:MAG: hypothetical protein Kow00121_09030 [Elainellaceae cyanobacterium]